MVERRKISEEAIGRKPGGNYFPEEGKTHTFIPSGCAVVDCVLGGGWALGRVSNIVGDKSAGKTLLAIEACANLYNKFPKGRIWYREAEAAFDIPYAQSLGLPTDRIDFGPDDIDSRWDTVEDIFEDLDSILDKNGDRPGLYVVDSLDALSSRAELKRKIDAPTFGGEKAKVGSEIFRRLTRRIKQSNIHLMVISQVRDKIGFVMGEKHTRSGGKALDFYASQILWLKHLKTLAETFRGQQRAWGIRVQGNCKKNKVSMPFRKCEFTIRFGYGVDDLEDSLTWLESSKMLGKLGLTANKVEDYVKACDKLSDEEYRERTAQIREIVVQAWAEVEAEFLKGRRKYA